MTYLYITEYLLDDTLPLYFKIIVEIMYDQGG